MLNKSGNPSSLYFTALWSKVFWRSKFLWILAHNLLVFLNNLTSLREDMSTCPEGLINWLFHTSQTSKQLCVPIANFCMERWGFFLPTLHFLVGGAGGQVAKVCLAQLRALPGGVRLSVKFDSSVRISGRLVRHGVGWHLLPHFGLSWILPVGFGSSLSVLCSLLGPPVVSPVK